MPIAKRRRKTINLIVVFYVSIFSLKDFVPQSEASNVRLRAYPTEDLDRGSVFCPLYFIPITDGSEKNLTVPQIE